jgi:two-component system, LytTR family, response regulator
MMENSSKITTLIIDDEPYARKCIRGLLETDEEIEIIGECKNGYEAIEIINEKDINLVFLDIQMPVLSGFDVLAAIDPPKMPSVIFVTAYDSFILKALKHHALDYLLKPFSDEEFRDSLRQAKECIIEKKKNKANQMLADLIKDSLHFSPENIKDQYLDNGKNHIPEYLTRLMVSANNRIIFLNTNDIEWIEADDNYVKVHTIDKSFIMRETMNDLEVKLNPKDFARIHRSAIVNVSKIQSLEPYFKGDYIVILNNGKRLKMTRSRKSQFKETLNIVL